MYHRCYSCCRLALLLLSIQLRREKVHAFSNYPSSTTSSSSFPSITYRSCTKNSNKNPRATHPLRRKHIFFSSSSSKDNVRSRSKRQRRNILNGSMLIAGTTVGGGFLALPTVVAPNGFIPSAITLVTVWAYFWMESLVLVECLILTRQISMQQADGEDKKELETEASDTSVKEAKETIMNPGISAAARAAFGFVGEKVVLILLVVLTEATIVSQIARAGKFFSPFYRAGCAIVAISMAGLVFGTPNKVVTETNSILTILFCILAVTLFGSGAPAADWSNLQQFSSWTNIPQAIPTFLQLLVYGEILPAICRLLDYQSGPIRWAITIGSILPLILEVGWAALGIGLLPVTSSAGATRLGISTASDPVDLLLAVGPVRLPLFALAITAITTTIIGSYLALQSAMDDVFPFSHVSEFNDNKNNDDGGGMAQAKDDEKLTTIRSTRRRQNRRRAIISSMWIVLPALGIASISPNLFLQAIDFAGSYPVILLWGLAPAAINYRLRQKHFSRTNNSSTAFANSQYSLLPRWWLLFVSSLSFLLFSMSAVPGLISLTRRILKFI